MTFPELAAADYVELRYPFGASRVVSLEVYRAMPWAAKALTIALPLSRRQVIARAAARRRAA